MGLGAAITSVFRQYARFAGRARRAEYWWWTLFATLVGLAAAVLDVAVTGGALGETGPIATVVGLALLLPNLTVTVRRLHDTDKSGWRVLWGLLPIVGAILLIVWCVQDSTTGVNDFGPNPKVAGGYGPGTPAGTWS